MGKKHVFSVYVVLLWVQEDKNSCKNSLNHYEHVCRTILSISARIG